MNSTQPYRVTSPEGKIPLIIMDQKDPLPAAFALMGTRAKDRVAVRILGGCKGMSANDKREMVDYFAQAFAGFGGVSFAGGTRMTRDGLVDPMITDIPGVIALGNEGSVALGTMPRTDVLTLQDDSRLVLDQYGTVPNPDMNGLLIVQNGPDGSLDWDGDVSTYFNLMQQWKDYAGFTALATVAWNGGPVTLGEIKESSKRGWPTILVQGSGRATDDVINALSGCGDELTGVTAEHIRVVNKNNPMTLRKALQSAGILQ